MRARGILLSIALLQAASLAASAVAAAPRPAVDPFTLTAGGADLANYYPTYLANGYWSVASSPLGIAPTASQVVGVMDRTPADVARPAAVPRWNEIDYFDGAEWLGAGNVSSSAFADYRQVLDMHDGQLRTRYRWHSTAHATDISTTTFVSQSDAHLAAVTLDLLPHFSGVIRLRFTLRPEPPPTRLPLAAMSAEEFAAAAATAHQPDLAAGGNRRAIWYAGQVDVDHAGGDAASATLWMDGHAVGGLRVALGAAVALPAALSLVHSEASTRDGVVLLEVEARVERDTPYRITKFVAASAEGWGGSTREDVALASRVRATGRTSLLQAQAGAWHDLWKSDITVGGSPELQRTLHSDLFYLLENSAPGTDWPAAACGFSSHYFGHVFWDNDFWVFPALLLLHSERAKSLIEFRTRSLPQARARAAAHGLSGAMYPWEADPATGEDVTPGFAVQNADREIHVNAAVALAQWQYFLASGDRAWLARDGFPVMSAVADFWASRATWVPARRRFEVLDVTSPEEDYVHVDNEIYTNVAAHQSLTAAVAAARLLGIVPKPRWGEVADKMYLPTRPVDGHYLDFDATTPHDKTTSWMATSVPMLSIPALGFDTDADSSSGLFAHSVEAIGRVRDRANQMILVMLATEAANVGKPEYFREFIGGRGGAADPFLKPPFNVRSETPQNDSVYLLATSGGFVQAFMFGLSGLRLGQGGLEERYPPTLPLPLTSLKLGNLTVRGNKVDVMISRLPSGRIVRHIIRREGS